MRLISTLLVVIGAGTLLSAQTNTPGKVRTLSLQDCIQLALQHNLDLQFNRYSPEIARLNLKVSYAAYDPTLKLSGEHDHNEAATEILGLYKVPGVVTDGNQFSGTLGGALPWGTTYTLGTLSPFQDTWGHNFITNSFGNLDRQSTVESSFGQVGLRLNQPLLKNLWIDDQRLNIRVAKNRLKYSELVLQQQVMQTVTSLEQAYFDLIYNRQNVVVQEKAVELAVRLVAENKKRLEVGSLAELDLKQAEAQAATSQANLIAARATLAVQEHLVKQLIAENYAEWADIAIVPSGELKAPKQFFSRQESWNKGLTQRPELLQSRLDLERAGIQLKYSYNQLFPQLDVFGSYGYNGGGTEFSDALYDVQKSDRPFYTYGGSISIPLGNVSARNSHKVNKLNLEQALLTLKRTERDIMMQIDNDLKLAQSSYELVAATRAAREYEEAALDAEQKKLESGKSTTYTVLQVQRDLTTARGNEIQALDTYNRNLSQLSLDEGSTLMRLNIGFEVVK